MRNGSVALVIGVAFLLGACGGGTTGASSATGTQAPPAATGSPTDAGTGSGGQPSAEASGPAATEAPPAGGGTAAGVCELVTPEELAGIFGVAAVTTSVVQGPPDNCIVQDSDGNPLVTWSLTTAQAAALYDAFTVDPSTVPVSGIGDKAAIVQNTGLMILKGSSLLVVTISGGSDMSEEEGIEASKEVGTLAAGRL